MSKILFFIAAVLLGSFARASSHIDPSDQSHTHPELSGHEGDAAIAEQIHAILDNALPQLTDSVSGLINHAVDQATQNMVPQEEVDRLIGEAMQNMVPREEVDRLIGEATQNMASTDEEDRYSEEYLQAAIVALFESPRLGLSTNACAERPEYYAGRYEHCLETDERGAGYCRGWMGCVGDFEFGGKEYRASSSVSLDFRFRDGQWDVLPGRP